MTADKVFIIGATGNVGTYAVKKLLADKVPTTIFVRNVAKAKQLFGDDAHLTVVQGSLEDLSPLAEHLRGHTRLFLLANAAALEAKGTIGQLAFAAGFKQIVDISGGTVGAPWRTSFLGHEHYLAEQALLNAKTTGTHVVTLRPMRFMSNLQTFERAQNDTFYDIIGADEPQCWISPRDIGELAATILQEDIKKHGDAVYEMGGDVKTPAERIAIFERVLGRPFAYQQVTPKQKFDSITAAIPFLPFQAILELSTLVDRDPHVSLTLPILLGRKPESLEQYVQANRHLL